jgi:hypothetical protein
VKGLAASAARLRRFAPTRLGAMTEREEQCADLHS